LEAFEAGCRLLGLHPKKIPFHFPVREEFWDESLFVFSTQPGFHCVRFYDYLEPTEGQPAKVLVMDPDWKKDANVQEFKVIDGGQFQEMNPTFYRLKFGAVPYSLDMRYEGILKATS